MSGDLAVTLGKRIRQIRRKRGYTQETLAELIGTSQGHLGKVERGEVQVGTELLQKLAEALTVDIGHLFQNRNDLPREVILQRTMSLLQNSSDKDLFTIYKIVDSILS